MNPRPIDPRLPFLTVMDLKERLNRLTSISKTEERSKSEVLSDLRQKLDRLFEPRKIYQKRGSLPIEKWVKGEVVSTPYGETFLAKQDFPGDVRCGEMTFSEILGLPTYPAHLLSRDERLRELDLRKTLFLDTETTGLTGGTGTIAFLIGLGFFQTGHFVIHQLFMRDYSEESAALFLLKNLLDSFEFLVTFNGRHYDVPLLETRLILCRTASKIGGMPHFDLLFPSRRIWKGAYDNCRLVTLESNLLGICREDDVPSEWIPQIYFDYLRTGEAHRVQRVFYHNQMDILAMVGLIGRIHLIYHDPHAARPRKGIELFALGRLFWDHGSIEKSIPCFESALHRCDDDLAWEVMKWLSRAFRKTGQGEKARSLWEEMVTWSRKRDVFPYVELAKYHEHRLRDFEKALAYVDMALQQTAIDREKETEILQRRRRRLELKRRPC